SFNAAAPDSHLNTCHPRSVNAYAMIWTALLPALEGGAGLSAGNTPATRPRAPRIRADDSAGLVGPGRLLIAPLDGSSTASNPAQSRSRQENRPSRSRSARRQRS